MSSSQGGSVQYLIQRAQTYVISILFLKKKNKIKYGPWPSLSSFSIVWWEGVISESVLFLKTWILCPADRALPGVASPRQWAICVGKFAAHGRGSFPQRGALWLRAFRECLSHQVPVPSAPCWVTRCPDVAAIPHSGWGNWRAEAPQQVLTLPMYFCASPKPFFPLTALRPLCPLCPLCPWAPCFQFLD